MTKTKQKTVSEFQYVYHIAYLFYFSTRIEIPDSQKNRLKFVNLHFISELLKNYHT